MPDLKITIVDKTSDTISGLLERGIDAAPLKLVEAVISENGTASGRPCITFLMQDEEGNYFATQTTTDLVEYGLYGVIRGVNAKWKVPPKP